MIIPIRRVHALPVLLSLFLFSACSPGVDPSSAGGVGTNSGTTGLILFATLTPENFSSNAFAIDCTVPPDGVIDEFPTTDSGDFSVTVQDPTGIFATQSQGITLDTYVVSYTPINQGVPIPLTPKSRGQTQVIPLGGGTSSSLSFTVILIDLETKAEYATRDSGSPNTYNVTVTYQGRDFISGTPVQVVATAQMELGAFCDSE